MTYMLDMFCRSYFGIVFWLPKLIWRFEVFEQLLSLAAFLFSSLFLTFDFNRM